MSFNAIVCILPNNDKSASIAMHITGAHIHTHARAGALRTNEAFGVKSVSSMFLHAVRAAASAFSLHALPLNEPQHTYAERTLIVRPKNMYELLLLLSRMYVYAIVE